MELYGLIYNGCIIDYSNYDSNMFICEFSMYLKLDFKIFTQIISSIKFIIFFRTLNK